MRCRLDDTTRAGAPAATFSHPPEIYSITAAPLGALVPSAHSVAIEAEQIGESDGTPGQAFRLRNAPVLSLEGEEGLEVLEPESTHWRRWDLRESFAESGPSDPHYTLDLASGEVELGPAIRTGDGAWRQYGMVPAEGRAAADGRLPPRRRPPRQRRGGGPHRAEERDPRRLQRREPRAGRGRRRPRERWRPRASAPPWRSARATAP